MGGREISQYITPVGGLRQTTLPYTSSVTRTWNGNIPDQFRTLLSVNLTKYTSNLVYVTTVNNQSVFIDDVYGRKLTYDTNFVVQAPATFTGTLNVKDEFGNTTALATYTNSDDPNYSVGTLTLTVNHPYCADAAGTTNTTGTYMDTVVTRTLRYATPFTIVNGWGETNRGLIDKWATRPNTGLPLQPTNGCDTCATTYHNSKGDAVREQMAASWLVQTSKADRLHASIANAIYTHHHTVGVVAGDTVVKTVNITTNPGEPAVYNWSVSDSFDRMDAETGFSVTSLTENASDRRVAIHAIAATNDALEGSVAAQNSDLPDTVSTAMRFEWGNAPPASEDPSGSGGSIGPRRFYDFRAANTSLAQSLMLVEGKLTTTSSEEHPGTDPTIGPSETGERQAAVSSVISSYANGPGSGTWDVVASEEAFLGPGQRGGAFTLDPSTHLYTHNVTQQRGGAFVATRYDATTGDPLEIAHIAANVAPTGEGVGIKGGGGGAQTNQEATYDPALAADILKSQFVDRTKAVGVDLESGAATYVSPAALTVGNGEFPYALSASLIWRGGPVQSQIYSPISHTAPTTPWTTNWNNSLAISGSGLEAMGDSDIRASAGTVAAFMAMQDIYRSAVSSQREVAALLTVAWWAHQIAGNVATVNVGADSRHFLQRFDGTWFSPGAGAFGSLTQTGARAVYAQSNCGGGPAYATTRGWDYSQTSYKVTNSGGDQQSFVFWSTNYLDSSSRYCAFLHGLRMTNWTFPFGMAVNLVYQAPAANQLDDLVQVNNSLGRQINFVSSGLGGFNNGLTGNDLRTVSTSGPIILTTTSVTHTEPTSAQTTIHFSLFGTRWVLNSVLRADNSSTPALAYTYDSLGRVKQAQDAVALQSGNRNPYSFYLGEGARADRLDPAGGDYTVFNDIYRRPKGYADELGRTTAVSHDGRGRITSYKYPEGNSETFGYDDHNNTTSLVRTPKPGSVLAPISISATWDPSWNKPTVITDGIGCVTHIAYYPTNPGMSLLNTATRCKPDASQANPLYAFTYTSIGKLLQATDPTSLVTQNTYDPSNGNLLSTVVDPSGINSVTSYQYDSIGNIANVSDPRLNVTENQYDADRRKTIVIHHNGPLTGNAIAAERTVYDVLGRAQEQDGGVAFSGTTVATWQTLSTRLYTPNSKVLTQYDGAGDSTSFTYDPVDRVQIVTDAASRRVATVYDLAGQTLFTWRGWNSTSPPTAATVWSPASYAGTGPIRYGAYTYSLNGKQVSTLDADGNVSRMAYDGHDRLQFNLLTDPANPSATCTLPATDSGTPTCTVGQTYEKYSYDGNGNTLSRLTRDSQTINYTYDLLSRLILKDLPGTTTGDVYTGYDLAGRPTYAHFGSTTGTGVDYGYDTAKRLVTENTFGQIVSYQYDRAGNRIRVTWPDNNYIVHDFDPLNRDYQLRENGATSGVGVLAVYQYDPLSRQQSVTRGNGTSTNYGYDSASRLTSVNQDMAGSAQDVTFGLGYTIASQLQSRTNTNAIYEWNTVPTNSTFVPDALNRYSSVAGTTFGYDGRGNLQSDGTRTLTYDIENRLVSVVGGAGLSLTYDPLGRLWQTTSGTSITQFLYDGNRLVEEISNSGTVLRRYAHGPGTDNPVVWYEGAVLTDRRWLHTDERGSVIASTDGTGAATVYTYGPYGEPTSWSGSRFRYTGQIMLPEAQLYHYKARVYDPILGRFLQTDPIGATDDLNLYTYTGNDPLDRTDPTGLYTCSDSDKGADCAVVSKAIGTIKDAASKLPKDSDGQKALNKVLKFYGNDGEKNGVSVAFSGNGTANETMKGASITITFNLEGLRSEFSGRGDGSKLNVEMGATAAHEGQHGLDDQARGRSPHGDQEFVQTERNAFRTQSYVNEGERVPSAYGVWLPGISNEQRTRAINLNGDRGAENDCGPSPCP